MRQQHPRAGLADALQRLDRNFEVANMKYWKLQVDITFKRSKDIVPIPMSPVPSVTIRHNLLSRDAIVDTRSLLLA